MWCAPFKMRASALVETGEVATAVITGTPDVRQALSDHRAEILSATSTIIRFIRSWGYIVGADIMIKISACARSPVQPADSYVQKYQTEVIVLANREMGENDRVLALYTKDFGLVKARASAILTERSKMRYALQDYSRASVSLVRGRRGWRAAGAIARRAATGSPMIASRRSRAYALSRCVLSRVKRRAPICSLRFQKRMRRFLAKVLMCRGRPSRSCAPREFSLRSATFQLKRFRPLSLGKRGTLRSRWRRHTSCANSCYGRSIER